MPRLWLDTCSKLPAPTPPSSFVQGLLIVIEVCSAGCGVVSAWLLPLHLETLPVLRSCWREGIPRGNAGDSVSGTLARSGWALPLLRMLSSSPDLHPSADADVWVTAGDANNSRYYWCCVVLCPGCGCVAALMKTSALSEGWQSNKWVPEINKICINELQWLWMPNYKECVWRMKNKCILCLTHWFSSLFPYQKEIFNFF